MLLPLYETGMCSGFSQKIHFGLLVAEPVGIESGVTESVCFGVQPY